MLAHIVLLKEKLIYQILKTLKAQRHYGLLSVGKETTKRIGVIGIYLYIGEE